MVVLYLLSVLIAEILLVLSGVAFVAGLWVSRRETRRSLQWWQSRQNLALAQAAEAIRNGLLQESFVVRRNLELALIAADQAPDCGPEASLLALESFHTALKDLSDRLSPAYVEDHFPLAVQHWLTGWQAQCPTILMQGHWPEIWSNESDDQHRFLLMILEALFQLFCSGTIAVSPSQVQLVLQQMQDQHQLQIQFHYEASPLPLPPTVCQNVAHLRRIFRLMTAGHCRYRRHEATLTWFLHWRSPTAAAPLSLTIDSRNDDHE